jgi:hypothetical protein
MPRVHRMANMATLSLNFDSALRRALINLQCDRTRG